MKYIDTDNDLLLDRPELEIALTAITELGGPFHSPFAKHLQKYHYADYDKLSENLTSKSTIGIGDIQLLIDIVQVFLAETLDTDWGTLYEGISKDRVVELIDGLVNIQKAH